MMSKIVKTVALLLLFWAQLDAHSGKPKYHVIIDTDGALDDLRAITMLLAENDIRVLAITCSQGTLLPDSVHQKVRSLLATYHHEGIPIGTGKEIDRELPAWSSFAQLIDWGATNPDNSLADRVNAMELLSRTLKNYHDEITLIALGSLKTYVDWLNASPDVIPKIERIIWYNDQEVESGFNYKLSPESYDKIHQSDIPLDIISANSGKSLINKTYLETLSEGKSLYAHQILSVHEQPGVEERINQGHMQLWDDLIPIYLAVPLFFQVDKTDNNIRFISLSKGITDFMLYHTIRDLLESSAATNNRVFDHFPVDSSLYKPEYAAMMQETIEKFGLIEWKAICMTNEIHGHTGIYSIIGAKMGIRAMEYFNVGINNLSVVTFAGNTPPLSCFNDGIQISTGSTIGQGLIRIADSISTIPSAIFQCNDQKVTISLRPDIAERMKEEIKYGVQQFGLHDDRYWLYIEKLAIEYWYSFNRYDIFNIIPQ
jgi:pyrimidine-specific ribonucleoside hydrolase